MPPDLNAITAQINTILDRYNQLTIHSKYDDYSDCKQETNEVVTLLFAAIERLSPPNSRYSLNAKAYEKYLGGSVGLAVKPLAGILKALRSDYEAGYLQSFRELIHADVFSDFLDMAGYLLQQGYKDPAAVLGGSILEEHLRKLCQKNGMAVVQNGGNPKKADTLNAELASAVVYSKLDQKNVTAWLDLRNKAAHGNYAEYTSEQVALTLQGVRDFLARCPA
jgi:hypothetical protein